MNCCIEEIIAVRAFHNNEEFRNVLITNINPSLASSLLTTLSEALPLQQFDLGHLKRIRRVREGSENKLQLVLCPVEYLDSIMPSVREVFSSPFEIISVARWAPETNSEFEKWGEHWPLVFRPNELDKDRDRGHSSKEKATVSTHISAAVTDSTKLVEMAHIYGSGAVIVNSINNEVIVSSSEGLQFLLRTHGGAILKHPLYTPTLLCVEAVAAIIRGELLPERLPLLGEDPYLCSGLHLYLQQEPDLMSSMSLVHSRIQRVYFRSLSACDGALKSCLAMHALPSLNHHFRVFHVTELGEAAEEAVQ